MVDFGRAVDVRLLARIEEIDPFRFTPRQGALVDEFRRAFTDGLVLHDLRQRIVEIVDDLAPRREPTIPLDAAKRADSEPGGE